MTPIVVSALGIVSKGQRETGRIGNQRRRGGGKNQNYPDHSNVKLEYWEEPKVTCCYSDYGGEKTELVWKTYKVKQSNTNR